MKPRIAIAPSIGKFDPQPRGDQRLLVCVPDDLVGPLRLLAFVREETMGHALGRAIRRRLDELVVTAEADGYVVPQDDQGAPLALEHWPVADQALLLVPEALQSRVQPDGKVPSPNTYGDRPDQFRQVGVPVSTRERITARIAAFGQLTSVARWGAEVLRDELGRLLPGLKLWTLPVQQQIEALLPDEPTAWESARVILQLDSQSRATRAVPRVGRPKPGEDLRIPSHGDLFDE